MKKKMFKKLKTTLFRKIHKSKDSSLGIKNKLECFS